MLQTKKGDCLEEMGQNMVQQEERQRARRKGGNDGEGVSGERKGRVYNSWQKGHTYCREHTHTGPPGICRSLGRGRGRHLNPWLQCTGSDCCIWREKTQERNIHCFVQIHPVSSKLGNWRKSQKVDCVHLDVVFSVWQGQNQLSGISFPGWLSVYRDKPKDIKG